MNKLAILVGVIGMIVGAWLLAHPVPIDELAECHARGMRYYETLPVRRARAKGPTLADRQTEVERRCGEDPYAYMTWHRQQSSILNSRF
jgi:hypothetical protein